MQELKIEVEGMEEEEEEGMEEEEEDEEMGYCHMFFKSLQHRFEKWNC